MKHIKEDHSWKPNKPVYNNNLSDKITRQKLEKKQK